MRNIILPKLGIYTIGIKKEAPFEVVDQARRNARIERVCSTLVIGRTLVMLSGKANKAVYKFDRTIKAIKAHFDNEYTIHEWSTDCDGRYTVVKQLFRGSRSEDFDSHEEYVIVWTSLNRDKLHEYIDGLFWDCGCEHDCCGHWFSNLWTHKTMKLGHLAIVFIGHGRNV